MKENESVQSFFMNFLNLNGQAGIFLFDSVTNRIISSFVLLILVSHNVIPVLYGPFYLFLWCSHKIKLHYCVIFELTFPYQIHLSFCL